MILSFGMAKRSMQLLGAAGLTFALGSCGGGGSSSSGGGTAPVVQTAPRFTSGANVSVVENTADAFYTATATDPQGDAITFSVYSGPDAGAFAITSDGQLRFNESPNYDLPADNDGDNVYQVNLRATAGGESVDLALRVTVTNDREGIKVTRIATGFVEPVAFANIINKPILLVAQKDGRVFEINTETGETTENVFVRDNRLPGEPLAIAFGYPDSIYQEGIYLVTHDPALGLYIQAFNVDRMKKGALRLADPATNVPTASMQSSGEMFIAIGDPEGSLAQDSSSYYGKLVQLRVVDPYGGASLPSADDFNFRPEIIGDGIQNPGGFSPDSGRLYLADRGSTVQHEITIFGKDWRPLDFGWPFYEGAEPVRTNPPTQVNGPTIAYNVGDGKKEGQGIIAGLINDYNFFGELGHVYVFADTNGTIWTIDYPTLTNGFLHFASDLEVRDEDFAPDIGSLDSPVGFAPGTGSGAFYILDAGGDVFRVEGEG